MSTPYYQDELVTLYHGDCLEITEWLAADVLVTDPPYGSQPNSDKIGYGRKVDAATGFRGRVIANDVTTDVRDKALALWGAEKPRLAFATPRMPEPPGEWADRLVWDKREPGLNGGPWRYTHELIFVGGSGWKRQSASSFSILSFPSGNGSWEKAQHAHAKPVQLMESLILSAPKGVIAEPFAGSGSTVVAARNLGRKIIAVELDERHCETTVKRLQQQTFSLVPEEPRSSGWSGTEQAFDLEALA
ncbi:hypothetical protein ASC66_01130 [Leifsonia sp. Root4]|uniref:DNA methyltransferase n=1 Tax=Leifsonia sp. Root4 TaxID=1736525 RepID=UPI0006F4BE30|nr:DNA methyltransferase [Leifsonia sp. Root4]KQW07631.1 hypothetical protein ASC66_01130 [Leifsonia sp. Root4]